jgi:hypothetical protein
MIKKANKTILENIKMKKTTIGIFLLICLIIFMWSPVSAEEMKKLGQTGFQFMKIDAGARGAAMGGAFAAVATGADAVFWNTAGITEVTGYDVAFGQTNWFADIKQYTVGVVIPARRLGHFAVSFTNVDYGDIPRTVIADNELGYVEEGSYAPAGLAVGLSYAKKFTERLSIGGTVKYAHESLGSSTIQLPGETQISDVDNNLGAVAFDIGTLYYTGFKDLRLSMSVRNFSTDIEYETESFQMPLTFAIGVAMDLFSLAEMGADHKLTLAVDAIHPRDYSERMHVGMEYWFADLLALRGGYKANYSDEGIAAGFGVKKDLGNLNIRVDYSWTDMGSFLGNVHRFTVGGTF